MSPLVLIGIGVAILTLFQIFRTKAWLLVFVPWLYIPRDEFAHTLEINTLLLILAPPWVERLYLRNLYWRRKIAHERDLRRHA